jgi:hypothetical protein
MNDDDRRFYARWPLLLAGLTLTGAAVGIDIGTEEGYAIAAGLAAMGAVAFGGFIYAEGARHREWFAHKTKHDTIDTPEDPS